jgi:hypothetical protein
MLGYEVGCANLGCPRARARGGFGSAHTDLDAIFFLSEKREGEREIDD